MHPGLIGGIVGSSIGLIGGLIGTYMSIKNTRTQAERRFMIRASILMWIVLGFFLALMQERIPERSTSRLKHGS